MKSLLISSALILGSAAIGNAAILIDHFDGALNLNIPVGGANPSAVSGGNTPGAPLVIGGSRGITFTRTAGNGSEALNVDQGGIDILEFASGSFDTVTAFLQWDGDTNPNSLNSTGLGSVDLTEGGLNDRLVIAQHSDRPSLPGNAGVMTMTVYTNTGSASYTVNTVNTSFIGPYAIIELPFAAFIGTANFANVGAIELFITGNNAPGLDLAIDFIESRPVPEPASLLLAGAALLGLGLLRRRSA